MNLKVGLTNRTGQDGQATADFGLTYVLTQDIQLDGGIDVGLTRAAEDANPFLGLSFRLRAIAKEKTT